MQRTPFHFIAKTSTQPPPSPRLLSLSMPAIDLPAEIWNQIFNLATDEDIIFQNALPTSMAEHAWYKRSFEWSWRGTPPTEGSLWGLRSPKDALYLLQKGSYATKKAIIMTCKRWHGIGYESLFRCLYISTPQKLLALHDLLNSPSTNSSTKYNSVGWWTRRIHVQRFYSTTPSDQKSSMHDNTQGQAQSPPISMQALENALCSIISHCRNLEIFIIDWPLESRTFGLIIDALAQSARTTLRTMQCIVPLDALPKVIWAFSYLPFLVSASIQFERHAPSFSSSTSTPIWTPSASSASDKSADDEEDSYDDIRLGSASGLQLTLPNLQQLLLKGHCQEFIEQALNWSMPNLKALSIDCTGPSHRSDDLQPDVIGFLGSHGLGLNLAFLDLNCSPGAVGAGMGVGAGGEVESGSWDVKKILELCPFLVTVAFNADWMIGLGADQQQQQLQQNGASSSSGVGSALVRVPHQHITTIGLHGLTYAFGVPSPTSSTHTNTSQNPNTVTTSTIDPLRSLLYTRANDQNLLACCSRYNFPRLQRVRAVNAVMLERLNQNNGPGEMDGGYERWERWWNMCTRAGVRLEDCTGQLLGTLPMEEGSDAEDAEDEDEQDEEEEDDEEEEEEEGEEEYETGSEESMDEFGQLKPIPGWKYTVTSKSRRTSPHVNELRQLLEECRAMDEDRVEDEVTGGNEVLQAAITGAGFNEFGMGLGGSLGKRSRGRR